MIKASPHYPTPPKHKAFYGEKVINPLSIIDIRQDKDDIMLRKTLEKFIDDGPRANTDEMAVAALPDILL